MNDFSKSVNRPVDAKARINSIDTLRGVALLGILLMNIIAFGLPFASYFDPTADGNLEGLNLTTYITMDILVEGSMRAIFSMLFGAGMLIFVAKPEVDAAEIEKLFYRRTSWLIVFGAVNAYLLVWIGDILFVYGVAVFVLFILVRILQKRKHPRLRP